MCPQHNQSNIITPNGRVRHKILLNIDVLKVEKARDKSTTY